MILETSTLTVSPSSVKSFGEYVLYITTASSEPNIIDSSSLDGKSVTIIPVIFLPVFSFGCSSLSWTKVLPWCLPTAVFPGSSS